jgi:hypothetical protein
MFGRRCYYRLKPDHSVEPVDVRTEDDLVAWAREVWGDADDAVDRRRVAYAELAPGISVSTVFLGLDHSFGRGPPLVFETMVFDDYLTGDCWRWSTWDEAVEGHNRAVEGLKRALAIASRTAPPVE